MPLRTIIVPIGNVAKAKGIGKGLGKEYDGMYTTPCSPSGEFPATHYISSGIIDIDVAELLPDAVPLHAEAKDRAQKRGESMNVTQAETVAVVTVTDVSDEPPFVALERMELKLISGEAL